jgi:hypothetical protein
VRSVTRQRAYLWIAVGTAVWGACAHAASPSLGNILPRGGARGTDVELRCIGGNLADAVDLLFAEPGIAFKQSVSAADGEFKCIVSIAADCRMGRHPIWVRTASGISNLEIFSVGALTEIAETEPNNEATGAQAVALGTTVNGVVTSEDVDYYAVELEAGAKLAAEIEAIRLGHTLFDAKMRLYGPAGHELVSEDDTAAMRQDPAFVYVAEQAGRHVIAVSEAAYGGDGNCEYRLHVGTFPRPLAVTPMGGAPESPIKVSWLGDPKLAPGEIVLASQPEGTGVVNAANDSGLAPTPLAFRVSKLPGALEQEPNNAIEQATAGQAPGAFDGVIAEPGDVDWYAFDGLKDQTYEMRVWAREMGSPLDSVLMVHGPDGGQLAAVDDAVGPDSLARVTLPADGRYTIGVRDHLGKGGPTFAYRVEAAPSKQELKFVLVNNEEGRLAVAKNNRGLAVLEVRRGGFDGPIELEFRELPAGVTAQHGPIAQGQTTLPVLFAAAPDAAPAGAQVDAHGIWRNGESVLEGGISQTYRLVLGQNQTVFDSYEVKRLAMAVTDEAPFSLAVQQPAVPTPAGSNRPLRVTVTRKEGFDAPIDLSVPWVPNEVGVPVARIEQGQTETTIRVEVRGGAPRGEFPLSVVGTSAGYAAATPFVTIAVEEPWLAMEFQETQGELGAQVAWAGKLTVNKPFEGQFPMELLGLPKGISAEPQPITAATTDLTFPVLIAADAPEGKHGPFYFRAIMNIQGEEIALGLGGPQMKVFKPLPPELQQPAPAAAPAAIAEEAKPEAPARRTRFPNTQ